MKAAEDAFGASSSVTETDDGTVEVAHTGTLFAVDDAGAVAALRRREDEGLVDWKFNARRWWWHCLLSWLLLSLLFY